MYDLSFFSEEKNRLPGMQSPPTFNLNESTTNSSAVELTLSFSFSSVSTMASAQLPIAFSMPVKEDHRSLQLERLFMVSFSSFVFFSSSVNVFISISYNLHFSSTSYIYFFFLSLHILAENLFFSKRFFLSTYASYSVSSLTTSDLKGLKFSSFTGRSNVLYGCTTLLGFIWFKLLAYGVVYIGFCSFSTFWHKFCAQSSFCCSKSQLFGLL